MAGAAAGATPSVERGAYLFAAAGCGGCHTDPPGKGPLLAGGRALETPFGRFYGPNITPDPDTGIGKWDDGQLGALLKIGLLPDGDVVGSLMGEVVEQSTSRLTPEDRAAVIAYLRSLAAIDNPAAKATAPGWE